MNEVEGPGQVRVDHLVPVVRRELFEAPVADVRPGVADEHVDRAAEGSRERELAIASTPARSATSQGSTSVSSRPTSFRVASSFAPASRPDEGDPQAESFARPTAVARPIPLPAPVTRAVID